MTEHNSLPQWLLNMVTDQKTVWVYFYAPSRAKATAVGTMLDKLGWAPMLHTPGELADAVAPHQPKQTEWALVAVREYTEPVTAVWLAGQLQADMLAMAVASHTRYDGYEVGSL